MASILKKKITSTTKNSNINKKELCEISLKECWGDDTSFVKDPRPESCDSWGGSFSQKIESANPAQLS